jgi:hypothetical protein
MRRSSGMIWTVKQASVVLTYQVWVYFFIEYANRPPFRQIRLLPPCHMIDAADGFLTSCKVHVKMVARPMPRPLFSQESFDSFPFGDKSWDVLWCWARFRQEKEFGLPPYAKPYFYIMCKEGVQERCNAYASLQEEGKVDLDANLMTLFERDKKHLLKSQNGKNTSVQAEPAIQHPTRDPDQATSVRIEKWVLETVEQNDYTNGDQRPASPLSKSQWVPGIPPGIVIHGNNEHQSGFEYPQYLNPA